MKRSGKKKKFQTSSIKFFFPFAFPVSSFSRIPSFFIDIISLQSFSLFRCVRQERISMRGSVRPLVGRSVCFPFLGSGPEGFDDLCFHTYGGFSPPSPPPSTSPPQIPVLRPKFQARGPNPSLEAQIPASRPKS